ncbi:MAG: protein-L-isoaspartate(D-aspartate) O-methyltransferase [Planctomycetota bacterium]|jgi:protein-L-isoaspartate(D-aspartate) O-methyltransferase
MDRPLAWLAAGLATVLALLLGAAFGFGYLSCVSHGANDDSSTSSRTSDKADRAVEAAAKDAAKDVVPADLEDPHRKARELMVSVQIQRRGIHNAAVLAAMRKVPRHRFVPASLRQHAHRDGPLPIGHEQTISQPYIVAFMTDALKLTGDEKVLEIGTGSGYQAAVLGEVAREVFTIEIVDPLARQASKLLAEMGYKNIHVRSGDGYQGWPEKAPFDAIMVTAAPDHVPQPLIDQLKVGGRMVLPVGSVFQELVLIEKTKKGVTRRPVLPVRFVPMTGEAQKR